MIVTVAFRVKEEAGIRGKGEETHERVTGGV